MSIATYRGYVHTASELNLAGIDRLTNYSQRNKRLTETRTFHLHGEIIADTQAEIITKIATIENAYKDDYGDFRYTLDDGTLTHALLNSGDCVSGVKVIKRPHFPVGDAAELVTTRTFSVVLQATYDAPESDLVSWRESISTEGDGSPLVIVVTEVPGVQTVGGLFAAQIAPRTPVYYTQSGIAVGYADYPIAPPPFNPDGLFGYLTKKEKISGRQVGNAIRFFTTKWWYRMGRDVAVFGALDPIPTSQ